MGAHLAEKEVGVALLVPLGDMVLARSDFRHVDTLDRLDAQGRSVQEIRYGRHAHRRQRSTTSHRTGWVGVIPGPETYTSVVSLSR